MTEKADDQQEPQTGDAAGGDADNQTGPEAGGEQAASSRMRFKGIVEAGARDATKVQGGGGLTLIDHDEEKWNARSRQFWLMAQMTAVFVAVAAFVGLPLGNYFAHLKLTNEFGVTTPWNPMAAFTLELLLLAFIIPVLILFIGYGVSKLMSMINAAEAIAAAAQRFVTPDVAAADNVNTVGAVVQGHVTALNQGLDTALSRLASVEAMIRQHVEAIELAGDAIEAKAVGAASRVADERSRLMDLTESLNAHADSFAAAIAEKAKTTIESLQSAESTSVQAEKDFDERLLRLESAAERAFNSFEALREALRDVDDTMRSSAQVIDASTEETRKASERATATADAAAESAARNAANIGAAARAAAEEARKAADAAIDAARSHAEETAKGAIDAATEESERVQDAAAKALEDITKSTSSAISAATDGAAKAAKAAEDVSEAAKRTGEAVEKASSDVAAASERARKSSEDALKFSESEASRIEERNEALAEARAALEQENARLESLIEEQRKRADRLAEAIASQTDRLSRLAEAQLREQEAAARLAEAQNEMQARADRQAAEKKKAEEEARRAAEQEAAQQAEKDAQETLDLTEPAKRKEPPLTSKSSISKSSGGAARLDELARDIAERRPAKQNGKKTASGNKAADTPLTLNPDDKTTVKRMKGDVSWREILDAADDGAPLDLGAEAKSKPAPAKTRADKSAAAEPPAARDDAENAIRIIAGLQDFTYKLETRLYGDPPPALQERFDRGDRNVFANRLLRLNETDVKRRIRTESARDRKFEQGVHQFLQGFEQLLEDATTSETADEELEEYLSSPLGRVYLLIGATVGYFA
ncbi:MAG: hypothetical protein AAFW68_09305 [Pseudomonadota bacterium]